MCALTYPSGMERFGVIVIGGGHAGVEAAWAAASALGPGGRVALVTMDPGKIGAMSCNPAIGGLAKGQMVREIDALGGVMARATDHAGILFKVLNMSKGAAVRGPRAQCDKYHYAAEVQRLLASRAEVQVIAGTVDDLLVEDGVCCGVRLPAGWRHVRVDHAAVERNVLGTQMAESVFVPEGAPQEGANYARVPWCSPLARSCAHSCTRARIARRAVAWAREVQWVSPGCCVGLDLNWGG